MKLFHVTRISIVMMLAALFVTLALPAMALPAAASDSPTITVSDSTGKAGELIDVSISLANNPGIIAMRLNVGYDESVLRLVNTVDKGVLGKAVHYPGPDFHSPYILFWVNGTSRTNYTASGDIATLQFEILKDAVNSPITVSYDLKGYDILNADDQTVEFSIKNGIVSTVKETVKDSVKEENGYVNGSGKPGPGNEAANLSTGTSGAVTSENPNLVIIPPDVFEESGGKSSKLFSGFGIPLASGEETQRVSWWVWILIAIGINAIGMIVIVRINRRSKNN